MFTEKDIKPIPKEIVRKIKKCDEKYYEREGFYAYLTRIKNKLVKITVACKTFEKQWFCKQVAVHGVNEEKCLVKDIGYTIMGLHTNWYDENISKTKNNYDGKWCDAESKYFDPFAPIVNKKFALTFEKYKYSVADKYPYTDILKYLKIYEEYPEVEYLMKMGLYHLATKKSIIKKLKKDKGFRKWLALNFKPLKNEYGNYPYFSTSNILNAYKRNVTLFEAQKQDREIKRILDDCNYENHVSKIISKSEVLDFVNYLEKQETGLSSYTDYLRACDYLGLDMTLPKNKYPHDFKKWHDIRIDEYHTAKAEADEKERKELYQKFAIIAEKYVALQRNKDDDYVAIIARSPKDLIKEGEKLHHCVGRMGYDQKFVREESLIFFIRKQDSIDKPFVTVEYSLKNHKVLQCYGDHDSRPANEVLEFVNKTWLPYANRKLKKIA